MLISAFINVFWPFDLPLYKMSSYYLQKFCDKHDTSNKKQCCQCHEQTFWRWSSMFSWTFSQLCLSALDRSLLIRPCVRPYLMRLSCEELQCIVVIRGISGIMSIKEDFATDSVSTWYSVKIHSHASRSHWILPIRAARLRCKALAPAAWDEKFQHATEEASEQKRREQTWTLAWQYLSCQYHIKGQFSPSSSLEVVKV